MVDVLSADTHVEHLTHVTGTNSLLVDGESEINVFQVLPPYMMKQPTPPLTAVSAESIYPELPMVEEVLGPGIATA